MLDKIILIGGGGHCRSVIDIIELENRFQIAGIVDKPELLHTSILDYKVIGTDDDLPSLFKKYKYALITIGQIKSPELRINLFNKLKELGFIMPVIISPRAYVSKYSSIAEGTVVMHDVLINSNSIIGANCIINNKALVEHDCEIGNSCHLSTGVIINGGTIVENGCFVGSNATSKEAVKISEKSFIKAGSIFK